MSDFERTVRVPLPEWGTDAAELTIWRRTSTDGDAGGNADVDGTAPAPLIECATEGCGAPAAWRCRLARGLCYCSAACFRKDSPASTAASSPSSARSAAMALQMIPLPATSGGPATTGATDAAAHEPALSLEEPRHFHSLVVGGTRRGERSGGGEAGFRVGAGGPSGTDTGDGAHAGADVKTGTKKRKRKKKKKGPPVPVGVAEPGRGPEV